MPGEFDLRKGVHIKLLPQTHAEFRIIALRMGLSMQEIMEEFAQRVVAEEHQAIKVLKELQERKRDKIMEKMSPTDAESLFDIIEMEDPFKYDKNKEDEDDPSD